MFILIRLPRLHTLDPSIITDKAFLLFLPLSPLLTAKFIIDSDQESSDNETNLSYPSQFFFHFNKFILY